MTNVLAPMGFVPIRNKYNSGGGNGNSYPILYSNTELIGIGDVVRQNSSGYIVKCAPSAAPTGLFQGWQFRNRSISGGSMGLGTDNSITPWRKAWTGAQVLPTNQEIEAIVDDDPAMTMRVQCMGALTIASRGLLVDLVDSPGGPDLVFGRGKQKVSTPTTYYNITSIAVDGGTQGSGFTQNGVDLKIGSEIIDLRPADITVTAGAVVAITLLNPIHGLAANSNTLTVQAKPGYSGTAATGFTPTYSGAQTAGQFRIDRILEQPFRVSDSQYNTTGYDLSNIGTYSWVEVSFAKHSRGGTAMYAATA